MCFFFGENLRIEGFHFTLYAFVQVDKFPHLLGVSGKMIFVCQPCAEVSECIKKCCFSIVGVLLLPLPFHRGVSIWQIRTRISELEEALSWTDDIAISREMIVTQLQKDAEHLENESVQRLIKSYITKIYAHNDSINITGGVNMVDCGGRI